MKRSSRHGWTLVQLDGDVLRVVATGDRDTLRAQRDELTFAMIRARTSLHHAGTGVALYDANGALRDAFPSNPRTTLDVRVRWPEAVPVDGALPAVKAFQVRAAGGAQ